MKKTLIATTVLGVALLGSAVHADEQDHTKQGHQHRSSAYEQKGNQQVASAEKQKPTADGKRLPGRDCKFYEGATRQHSWPQYEIGNANRPECPPESK